MLIAYIDTLPGGRDQSGGGGVSGGGDGPVTRALGVVVVGGGACGAGDGGVDGGGGDRSRSKRVYFLSLLHFSL